MSKKKKALVAVFAVLGIAVLGLAGVVLAKYLASFEGTGEAKVAKWAFEADNIDSTFTCSMTSTVQTGAMKTATDDGTLIIAPGTSGKCDIQVKNTTSEVKVKYTISLADNGLVNAPTNLKLNGSAASSFAGVTGYLDLNDSETESITWDWPYETKTGDEVTGDGKDTEEGIAEKNMTINFKVTGVQVNPATGV